MLGRMERALGKWQRFRAKWQRFRGRAGLTTLALVAAMASASAPATAQDRAAGVKGIVVDKATRKPVVGAQVVLGGSSPVLTDSLGRFTMTGLAVGDIRLVVRAEGFPITNFDLTLQPGVSAEPVIQLDGSGKTSGDAQALPKVAVTTTPSLGPRYADFERRLKTGRGQYLTADEIYKGHYGTLQEAVRMMRGVEFSCGGGAGCYVRMARAPMECLPEYIIDDRVDNMFGPNTPIRDIQGIEVYNGPTDVPGEYAGRNAGCGVIVIWTKSGPTQAPRKP